MDSSDLWRLALLCLCLVLSGFFSGSETALIALSRARLTHLVSIGQPGASRVARLIQRPEKFLATVLLSNNLVNTAVAVLGTSLVVTLMGNTSEAVLLSTFGVTLVLLIFGETIPKTISWRRSETVAFAVSRPLTLVEFILTPGTRLLQVLSSLCNRLLGITGALPEIGEEEIRTLISVGAESGVVAQNEAELLEKVFRFGDRQMREIMTPRPEIIWLERGITLEDFLALYAQHSHTRFPVYEGSTENVVGLLSSKDVLQALGLGTIQPQDSVTDLMRGAYFVPETKAVGDTFGEMQKAGHGLVLTVDEFGGIAGLATSKQLLGIIVGQVGDEGDTPEEAYTPVDEHTFRLDAGVAVSEINEELDLGLPEGDYQTVAGFVLDHLGRIPDTGDVVEYDSLRLTVMEMSGVRIDSVEVRRVRTDQEEAQR
jgi:putative hemolysin